MPEQQIVKDLSSSVDELVPGSIEPFSPDEAVPGSIEPDLERAQFELASEIARTTIMPLLRTTTIAVIVLVIGLAATDTTLIVLKFIEPDDRLVTSEVIMAVIAATFAQVGWAAYQIVRSLFLAESTSNSPTDLRADQAKKD
jgi:hypothetical protein